MANNNKKYISLNRLSNFLDNLRSTFASLSHKHTVSDLTDYAVDSELSASSLNPVQNKVLNEEFNAVATAMNALEAAIDTKSDSGHDHSSLYYTQTQLDQMLSAKSDSTHNHDSAYDALGAAAEALTSAKNYADSAASTAANTVKNDLLNGAGAAYDTLKELGDLINENQDAIDALETVATGKADKVHTHAISDVTDLQIALDTLTENKSDKTHTHADATTTASGMMSSTDKIKLDNVEERATNGIQRVDMSSEDGAVWTATIDGVEELTNGKTFLFVPNRTSSSTTPTLNVNGLGAVTVKRKMSSGTATLCAPNTSTLFFANRPTLLLYDTATVNGTPYWIALEFTKPSATDLYGKVPVQNGGWFSNSETTDDDLVEAREAFGVYSKADHNWVQIYDSGATTEQINSFANINISGYKKIMMAIKCVNDTTNASTTRYGSAIFKATNGTTYQFPVFNSMFFGSETTTASIGFFEFIDGWIVCPQVVRSIKYADFLTSTEGGTCTNMNNMGSGLMKCTNPLSTVTISNLDQNADFFFGVGSRVIIWGSVI